LERFGKRAVIGKIRRQYKIRAAARFKFRIGYYRRNAKAYFNIIKAKIVAPSAAVVVI